MSNLIVIGFDDESTAFSMRAELAKMQKVSVNIFYLRNCYFTTLIITRAYLHKGGSPESVTVHTTV